MNNAATFILGVNVCQLAAMVWFGVRLGYRIGERDQTLSSHSERLDAIEPEVKQLGKDVSFLRGGSKAFPATAGQ